MKHVMIVEDNQDLSKILEKRLIHLGYAVSIEKSGFDLMSTLMKKDYKPDVVILDLMLPGRSGYDLLNSIVSIWPLAKVFVFTSHQEYKNKIPAHAVCGFFLKTDGIENLMNAIRSTEVSG